MTIRYSLTRLEIVRSFVFALRDVPKFRTMILLYSIGLGAFSLVIRGVFSRGFTARDGYIAMAWMFAAFLFMPVALFLRAKTNERVLSISEQGISTGIDSLTGEVPWNKVKAITDTGRYIVITGIRGNSFFIPSRAFSGAEERAKFLAQMQQWRGAS